MSLVARIQVPESIRIVQQKKTKFAFGVARAALILVQLMRRNATIVMIIHNLLMASLSFMLAWTIEKTNGTIHHSCKYCNNKKFCCPMPYVSRAVRNCSFRFDINIYGWEAFITKPISKSIMWKLDFETNIENKIVL